MRPSPRVRCRGCDFAWYGEASAHGLRIVGGCTRCGGELDFLEVAPEAPPAPTRAEGHDGLAGLSPAAVLGLPTSWAP